MSASLRSHDGRLRVLGIPGSLRSGSYNRALLLAAVELAPASVDIELIELDEIPPYDGDVEAAGDPRPVAALKEAIREADALLIATPEYNRGLPGVLKNALDWASRPPLGSSLARKPVAVMGASTGMGGTARAQEQLRQALAFPRARIIEGGELRVPEAFAKIGADGGVTDPETRAGIEGLLEALARAVGERGLPAGTGVVDRVSSSRERSRA